MVKVHLWPITVVGRRWQMRRRDDRKNSACIGQSCFHRLRALAKLMSQGAPPNVGIAFRIVNQPSPDPKGVGELFPVPTRLQSGVGIAATIAGDTGAAPAFKGERFHQIDPIASTNTESASVSCARERIAPEQQAVCARPNPMDDAISPIFFQKITVTVAEKTAGAAAEFHQARSFAAGFGAFDFTDLSLMIRHAMMFSP